MNDFLTVSLVQFDPVWEDKKENMRRVDLLLNNLPFAQDIVVFPEMFLTGFSMNISSIGESMNGEMVSWMKNTAKSLKTTLIGSLPIVENKQCFNRLLIVPPDNEVVWYDKRHLFRMGEEQQFYSGGKQRILYPLNDWTILPLVCYDLRFPVWSRNKNLEYNVLIYVTNWPAVRNDAYLSLLKARAIENQCYVIAVNRTGTDGNNISYCGNSVIFDAKGRIITELAESQEIILNAKLSLNDLNSFREKFPAYLDGDDFEFKNL
jgi:predicted amidohydrolase